MKRLVFLQIALFFSVFAFSQDIITRTSGEKIYCKVTNIDSTEVYFTMTKDGLEINTSISKSSTQDIQYGVAKTHKTTDYSTKYRRALIIGFHQGGGSIIGLDLEFLLGNRLGIQAGGGFKSFGGGINIHLKRVINSSYIAIQYWRQGIKDSYRQSLIGPSFVFRGRDWFTAQLGCGYVIETGPDHRDKDPVPYMLTYGIGIYIAR